MVSGHSAGGDESTFRGFIENLPVMFYAVDPTSPHKPIYISKTFERFGYPFDDWVTDQDIWARVIHEDDRDEILTGTKNAMAAGEGIETMLSPRCVMPDMAMVAALSAAHLGAILFPATLRRLYVVRDNDPAGDGAVAGLFDRAQSAGIEAIVLSPQCGDFNEDLRNFDINGLRAALRIQLTPEDVGRFLSTGV